MMEVVRNVSYRSLVEDDENPALALEVALGEVPSQHLAGGLIDDAPRLAGGVVPCSAMASSSPARQ